MAFRALWGSLRRPARSSLRTLCSPSICCYRLQNELSPVFYCGSLPPFSVRSSPFSSSYRFFNVTGDGDDRKLFESSKEASTSSASQELISGSSDISSPVDLLIAGLDNLNYLTGLPWWGTIFVSAIILRALMLPLKTIQDRKLAVIKRLGPKLQLERLARGSLQGKLLDEFQQLRRRKRELASPSLFWILGPGILLQIPLVLTLVYSVRRMALEQHLGFDTGGVLWFKDLTVPGEGLIGALLPLTVAAMYFGNVHVLFQGPSTRKGLYEKFQKAWEIVLKCSTLCILWFTYHAPQALQVFLVPHSIMTLSQTILFRNERFVAQVVRPMKKTAVDVPINSDSQQLAILNDYEKLLKDAGSQFTSGNSSEAIKLLKDAIKDEPEKGEAYALLGLVYKTQKDWMNSAFYYKQAISKGETDDFKIAAYAGCGLALLKQGSATECAEILRPIRSFQVPNGHDSRQCYYASLVILSRALLEAGLKDESQQVVQQYKELHLDK